MSTVDEPIVKSPIYAEGTLTPDADEAEVLADIAAVALAQTKKALTVALVERWSQPGQTIVRVTCGEDTEGTRTAATLGKRIATWEPAEA